MTAVTVLKVYPELILHIKCWIIQERQLNQMHIEINDNTKFKEIQEVFSDFYSFLLIEFFTKKHGKYESSMDIDLVLPDTSVGDVKKAMFLY